VILDRTVVPVLLSLVTEMSKSLDQSAVLISLLKQKMCSLLQEHICNNKDRYSKSNTTCEYIIATELYSHSVP
jgi:hypothetical protein